MSRIIGIGIQDFEKIASNGNFYVDKTMFIKEWWENHDEVTLITRPRRFGKTLNLSMLERFFSAEYAGQGEIFEGLKIWKEEAYRELQGTYPVISISFASVKGTADYKDMYRLMCRMLYELYSRYRFLLDKEGLMDEKEKELFEAVSRNMDEDIAVMSLHMLSKLLMRYYGRKVLILIDEYDTPMQEAFVYGHWDNMVSFMKNLFQASLKSNPYLDRALLTGITRVSKESIFSDLNHLEAVTLTSDKYADAFGFTQDEVSAALREFGMSDKEQLVREWYDGFTFGRMTDIYNPWSIIHFLSKKRLSCYWVNTSSNSLADKLVREGSPDIKVIMEDLLAGGTFRTVIDEQTAFSQLDTNDAAVWSLLLAAGYLKVEDYIFDPEDGKEEYVLKLTNKEVRIMFRKMITGWFKDRILAYSNFVKALLQDDKKAMNFYMNRVALEAFSYFDTGKKPAEQSEPKRFYHGFVLGLIAELSDRYVITSNRESGFGRYDVMLRPKSGVSGAACMNAILMEFKVRDASDEKTLEDTVKAALAQIEQKQYETALLAEGMLPEQIRKYGFAFEGKKVLIG